MRHFLAPIVANPATAYRLQSEASGGTIAWTIEPAFDSATRKRGLLGRDGLSPETALVLAPCAAVHTAFMRFPIDVVFTARDGTVLKVCAGLKPWRVAAALKAFAVIELAAGRSAETRVAVGDRLRLTARADRP